MTQSKEKKGPLTILLRIIQILLYIPIQILFIPFAILGLILGIYKEMTVSKKLGVSYSAGQTLQYRWFMHYFNTRPDPYSVAFTKKFPCESHFGLWATMGPLIIAQRVLGLPTKMGKLAAPGEETLESTAFSRVLLFDSIMEKHLDQVDQVVLLGVGFDMIALHFTESKAVKVFEMDQVESINIKVETLDKAGINHDWIHYVPVDFSKESWSDRLLESGYDKTKKTLFLWQSVSHFLEENATRTTLKAMTEISGEGSIMALDFYSKDFIFNNNSMAVKSQKNMMAKMGEPWIWGLDMSENPRAAVESFLKESGIEMTEYHQFGEKIGLEPFYCIVEGKN